MATLKLTLDERYEKSNGTSPIVIRISHRRKSSSLSTGHYIEKRYWDKEKMKVRRSHPNHESLNTKLRNKLNAIEKKVLKFEDRRSDFSLKELMNYLRNRQPNSDLFKFGATIVKTLERSGKYGTAASYNSTLSRLKLSSQNGSVDLNDIDYNFLLNFESRLLNEGVRVNSVAVYMRTLRAIYNRAIKSGIIDKSNYPFAEYKIKTERTAKRSLAKEEIMRIQNIELPKDTPIWHSRNYFILSFNLIGISFIDMAFLKQSNIQGDRIVYRRRKTGKIYNVKLTEKAKEILELYKPGKIDGDKDYYLLPVLPQDSGDYPLKQLSIIKGQTKITNKYLARIANMCGIDAKVTTYYARHSWATIARRMGYSKDLIAEALGHEYGNKVTGIYLDNYENEVIDEANRRIVH